jgi:hypothetical protein
MFEGIRYVIVPPYCGVPRLSHQFPVEVVDAVVVTGADVVVEVGAVVAVVTGIDAVVEVGVVAGTDVVLDLAQDAKINDVTMRQVSTIQKTLFFT